MEFLVAARRALPTSDRIRRRISCARPPTIFLHRNTDGTITEIALTYLDGDGELDLAVFHGASSGIVAADDLDEAGTVLEPGCSAALVVYENLWAAPLAAALRRTGAQIVAGGRIPHEALIASVTATETDAAVTT